MNQFEILRYLQTGTVVSAKSLSIKFGTRCHEAKRALSKLMGVEGMHCREKKVGKSRGGHKTYTIFWYESRNNI